MATTTETLMVMGVTGSELAAAARIRHRQSATRRTISRWEFVYQTTFGPTMQW